MKARAPASVWPAGPGACFFDGLHEFLEGDLPRRMIEALSGQPQAMFTRPMTAAGIDASMAQKKAQNLLAGSPHSLHCRLAGAAEIAHSFVGVVGNPNRRQFPRTEQGGQGRRVAAIGLDVIARPRRNERRRNHHTFMAKRGDLPIEPIAARPRFVAESELAMLGAEPGGHFGHNPAGLGFHRQSALRHVDRSRRSQPKSCSCAYPLQRGLS